MKKRFSNDKVYSFISILDSGIMIWPVLFLFYRYKGLSFIQIGILQSICSVVTFTLEIPFGIISDRIGHKKVLIIGSLTNALSFIGIILMPSFTSLILVEVLSGVGDSATSGSDVALLFNYLNDVGERDNYQELRSKIRQKQAVIRFFVRIISTVLYTWNCFIPFIISVVIKIVVLFMSFLYHEPAQKTNAVGKTKWPWKDIKKEVLKREYLLYVFTGSFMLLIFCEISQYMGPIFNETNIDVAYLGAVLAIGSLMDFAGSKLYDKGVFGKFSCGGLSIVFGLVAAILFVFRTPITVISGYVICSLIYAPFSIKLSDGINRAIKDEHRATLLSIENQFDTMALFVFEPIMGIGFDNVGITLTISACSFLMLVIMTFLWRKGASCVQS
ncbi:MAG: MFS transporter [Bacteroidales bacterium]|nr:MFS transporter [Bacteroidales bacterium]